MLRHLSIRNYAIADSLDIEFSSGLTAITGETGAGKSIILGAMGLILGDRADREIVRSGAERAEISAEFDLTRLAEASAWLRDNDMAVDGSGICLIRRSVSADGRSRAWINGAQVTQQMLGSLGTLLMDIHGQHEHHSLLQRATQQLLLDNFAGLAVESAALRSLSEQWRLTRRRLEELQQNASEQSAAQELARYQLNELEDLALEADELKRLDAELDQLSHAESRLESLQRLLLICKEDDENNILRLLEHGIQMARDHGRNAAIAGIEELLNTALIQVEEAASEISRQLDHIEINPLRLAEVNQRLGDIHQLARKHKVSPEELPALLAQLQEQLTLQNRNAEEIARLTQSADELARCWQTSAAAVSAKRREAASRLTCAVNQQLAALAMADAELSVEFHPAESAKPQPNGLEQAEFLIRTNIGQTPKPLARIASGGELSRISLAIQVITALTSDTPTLVFDEVDVGIGGSVARIVGRLLKQLGERCQVMCVTHQAQVAGQADHHLLVSKRATQTDTVSSIEALNPADRLREVARMLGGETGTDGQLSANSLSHASELMNGNG